MSAPWICCISMYKRVRIKSAMVWDINVCKARCVATLRPAVHGLCTDAELPVGQEGSSAAAANKLAGRLAALLYHPVSRRAFYGFQFRSETYLRETAVTDLGLSAILKNICFGFLLLKVIVRDPAPPERWWWWLGFFSPSSIVLARFHPSLLCASQTGLTSLCLTVATLLSYCCIVLTSCEGHNQNISLNENDTTLDVKHFITHRG